MKLIGIAFCPLFLFFITKLTSIISEAKERDKFKEGKIHHYPYHRKRS